MLLRGYIDESVDKKQNIFTLACQPTLYSESSRSSWVAAHDTTIV
jgi:hypothetical protein